MAESVFPVLSGAGESVSDRGPAPLYSVPLSTGIGYDVLVLDTSESLPRERSECFGHDSDGSATKTANLDKVNWREAPREGALGHVDVENTL